MKLTWLLVLILLLQNYDSTRTDPSIPTVIRPAIPPGMESTLKRDVILQQNPTMRPRCMAEMILSRRETIHKNKLFSRMDQLGRVFQRRNWKIWMLKDSL